MRLLFYEQDNVNRQHRARPLGFILGAGPFLYFNPPAVTLARLSDARLCSLISARGANALGNPLLRLGLPRRFGSLWTWVAPWALAKTI